MKMQHFLVDVDNPEIVRAFGESVFIYIHSDATNGDFSVIGQPCPAGQWSWAHRHRREHHFIQVARGKIEFEIGGQTYLVESPNSVFVPRMTWHRFKGVSVEDALMVFTNIPGGIEKMFLEISARESGGGLTDGEYAEIAEKYGVDIAAK